jgi:hypothetical protein
MTDTDLLLVAKGLLKGCTRDSVDERTAARGYHHHLMDYNNDPTTHLRDVQTLFEQAESEIRSLQ